jgi:hypothetical protein
LSSLLGSLAVGVCYAAGRVVGGRRVGICSALALIALPFSWFYAQDARPVAILPLAQGLMFLGALLRFERAAERDAPSLASTDLISGLIFAFGGVLSIYAHTSAIFFFAAFGLVVAAASLAHPALGMKSLRFWAICGAVVTIAAAPIIVEMARPSRSGAASWIPEVSPLVIGTFAVELAAGNGFSVLPGSSKALPVAAALLVYAAALWGAVRIASDRLTRTSGLWLLVGVPAAYVLVLLGISAYQPLLVSRYALGLEFPLAILLGAAAALTRPRSLQIPVAALALAYPAFLSARERLTPVREDWRALVARYESEPACARAAVVAPPQFAHLGWPYYGSEGRRPPAIYSLLDHAPRGVAKDGAYRIDEREFVNLAGSGERLAVVTHIDRSPQMLGILKPHRDLWHFRFAGGLELICAPRK